MERITVNTQYLNNHHNILGPARFLPYESRGWRAPIFDFGGHLHHRPMFGGFGFGGGMYEQNIIIDNGRSGFWGNLADGIQGFLRGFTNASWLMGGGMQQMYNPMMMQQPMMMPSMAVQPETDTSQSEEGKISKQEFTNLTTIATKKGYKVVPDTEGTYTAFSSKDHISGDYETVKDWLLKAEKVEEETETKKKDETAKKSNEAESEAEA